MYHKMLAAFAIAISFLAPSPAFGEQWRESPELTAFFETRGEDATFVVYDVQADTLIGYNKARAYTRFIPASTFKIPNSVIGLSVGAVKNTDSPLPYGGKPLPVKAWERDMGLREAIKISNVPIYQELARRIGLERMRAELERIGYGNNDIGSTVDAFWLEGPLAISAVEQVQFLARLAQLQLPQSKEAQRQVRDILLAESGNGWALFAKTGTSLRRGPATGWWVGWVEKEGKIYTFAHNLTLRNVELDSPKREALAREGLRILGLL